MSAEPSSPFLPSQPPTGPDVWAEQDTISRQLAAWAAASIVGGAAVALAGQLRGSAAMRALGTQNAAWGAIDLAVASLGAIGSHLRRTTATDPVDPAVQRNEWHKLHRVLLINAGLDVGYIAAGVGGLAWSLRPGCRPLPALVGHSSAVALQGSFLLAFDTLHARATLQQLDRGAARQTGAP